MKAQMSIIILIASITLFSCDVVQTDGNLTNDDSIIDTSVCASDNPLEDIQWLKEKKGFLEVRMTPVGWQIIRYKYNNEYVFWIDECYNCADNLISVYNCEGNVICEFGGIAGLNTCPDFETAATDSTMLVDCVNH